MSTRQTLEQQANERLTYTGQAVAANLSIWLDLNVQSLQSLVALPDVYGMDAGRQRPALVTMANAHPHIYLVSTTGIDGVNVARSDDQEPRDYGDRTWFQGASSGDPLTYQTLIGRTSGEPALVASMPITDESGDIVGVGMLASDLTDLSGQVQVSKVGESGFTYVVDSMNQVVAHPDPAYSAELRDLTSYPPVAALRAGRQGIVDFTDQNGQAWRAFTVELDNGWGVFVQQPMSELLQQFRALGTATIAVAIVGTLMLLLLSWLTIRQAIRPIGTLTDTATAIAAGDLDREAPVESEDEIGTLARSFNSMTEQLRGLIGSLEHQVAERTRDLARRSAYLQATADVGRAASSILKTGQLIEQVVELIRERFDLYYVGLFEVDPGREWAILRAGTGMAGSAMLARGHRIRVGEGMIGWSVEHGQSRVALVAEEDAVRLATAELPETRSEAALPLRSRGVVVGALTVQHTQPGAFDPDTLAVLQTMADQVAVALDNARLYTESQEALEATRRAFGQMSRESWRQLLRPRQEWGYRYAHRTVAPVEGERSPVMLEAERTGQTVQRDGQAETSLVIPLRVRDQIVGTLGFRKEGGETWTREETDMAEAFTAQLETALEGARLYQDVQRRASEDRLVAEITDRLRATLDVDTVLQAAVREVGSALGVEKVELRLEKPESPSPEPRPGLRARALQEEERHAGVD
jgi:GAF domain-containing protein/HAMP domain-containing protein